MTCTAIVRWLDSLDGPVDGITVSGGEPFQQPERLATLLTELDEWRYGGLEPLAGPAMQLCLEGDVVRLIGIPRRGGLDRMRTGLVERGLAVEAVTWLG